MAKAIEMLGDIEHILKRPSVELGSYKPVMDVVNIFMDNIITPVQIMYSPGLLKLADELIVNVCDARVTYGNVKHMWFSYSLKEHKLTVKNDGTPIDIGIHPKYDIYIPEMIFTRLRTSSNYNDDEERNVGGMNGLGAKLVTIFSTWMCVTIVNTGKKYVQVIRDNDSKIDPPTITDTNETNYVQIEFIPDFKALGIKPTTIKMKNRGKTEEIVVKEDEIFRNTILIMLRRCIDVCGIFDGKITLVVNNKKLNLCNSFLGYASLYHYFTNQLKENRYVAHSAKNYTVIITPSDGAFHQVSFVNSIETMNGGSHVDVIVEQILKYASKHYKELTTSMRTNVKNSLQIIMKCTIDKPDFDSQAKTKLTTERQLLAKSLKLSPTLIARILELIDIEKIINAGQTKAADKDIKLKKGESTKSILKLHDAELAGKDPMKCTLFIMEGDSAKGSCKVGISTLPNPTKYYGILPLRGKIPNADKISDKKYIDSKILITLRRALGLTTNVTDPSQLRYGRLVVMVDADVDGMHILGLVLSFFNTKFPVLLQKNYVYHFVTPVIQIWGKSGKLYEFYNQFAYEKFIEKPPELISKIKYIKGLGTLTNDDMRRYFAELNKHLIKLNYDSTANQAIRIAFSDNNDDVYERKKRIMNFDKTIHVDRKLGEPVNITDIIYTEVMEFGYASVYRAMPSVIDGLKPVQRKILATMINHVKFNEDKVTDVAGKLVLYAYEHGESSAQKAVIRMAQAITTINNLPLLEGVGQFGSRFELGGDAAAPRYVSVKLHQHTLKIYRPEDNIILQPAICEGKEVEPEVYYPIIPVLLLNGAKGLGMGFQSTIPSHNINDLVEITKTLLNHIMKNNYKVNDVELKKLIEKANLTPYFIGYKNSVTPIPNKEAWMTEGTLITDNGRNKEFIITELPPYQSPIDLVADIDSLKFVHNVYTQGSMGNNLEIKVVMEDGEPFDEKLFMKTIKLKQSVSVANLIAITIDETICHYATTNDIFLEWFLYRHRAYQLRKFKTLKQLEHDIMVLSNKARFIDENVKGVINIRNVPIVTVNSILEKREYDKVDDSYKYLLDLPVRLLTKEEYERLMKSLEQRKVSYDEYKNTHIETIWLNELNDLINALN